MTNNFPVCDTYNTQLLLDWGILADLNVIARGPLIIETALWGIFSCLIIFSVFLWIRDGIRTRQRMVMMAVCIVMYMVSTAHWGISVGWWQKTSQSQERRLLTGIESALTDRGTTCSSFVTPQYEEAYGWAEMPLPTCALMALVAVNVILSDAIVLFRACTILDAKRAVRAISVVLFVILLGTSLYNIYTTCAIFGMMCSFCSFSGIMVVSTSFVLNVWATAIVGYKACVHKRTVKNFFAQGDNTRVRPERVLTFIVDSGLLYCTLWTIVMISEFTGGLGSVILSLQNACLIQLVGMYPTILVTAVAFERLQGSQASLVTHDRRVTQNETSLAYSQSTTQSSLVGMSASGEQSKRLGGLIGNRNTVHNVPVGHVEHLELSAE
ncbi:hypothetical protein BDY19DRAFT_971989 [Irpex rosettiformis]|uniref:Uncharacterized protein n=1 Tax=Irpex rosettiformis TaxID=378272 RepID=A0ACB8TQR3_9APHY|nr:hypothetical protein BDY19DRAFT_971989 [Irpex rosettiformis]